MKLTDKHLRKLIQEEIQELSIAQKKRNEKNIIDAIKQGQSGFNAIKTFAVFTAQNPDSSDDTSYAENKKRNHTLLRDLKQSRYVVVPVLGVWGGSRENSYAVINISLHSTMYYCGLYEQTSFIYSKTDENNGTITSYYYEKENTSLPFNKNDNPYVLKDEAEGYIDVSSERDNFTAIGKKFKFQIDFPSFREIDEQIVKNFENNKKWFGKNSLTEKVYFSINKVGQSPYILRGVLYEGLLEYHNKIKFRLDKISQWTCNNDKGSVITESNNWILKRKNWEINNYQRFLEIVNMTPKRLKGFLTYHGIDEITGNDWITYCLKGHNVAFALHLIAPGQVDLCNLVNNSDLKGIGDVILQFAKNEGATQMDNYRGFKSKEDPQGNGKLGNLYRKNGFDRQTWHDEFNPEFQPSDEEWQLDKSFYQDGKGPDVEGLELSRHRKKYNNTERAYREKWNKRIKQKFEK